MSIICCSFSFVYVFNLTYICSGFLLTHYGLMKPYDDRHLDQHWLRWWLVAWWHQAIIAWTITILHTKHNQVIYRFFICSIIGLIHWAFVLDCVFNFTQPNYHSTLARNATSFSFLYRLHIQFFSTLLNVCWICPYISVICHQRNLWLNHVWLCPTFTTRATLLFKIVILW